MSTSNQIGNPLPNFIDLEGKPLSGGYVFVGAANADPRSSPASVFYDSALTITATQPLRTALGFLYRNGSPTSIYTGGECSVLVLDSHRRQVYYVPSWNPSSSDGFTFLQAGTGAVARTAQSKMREVVSVTDFSGVDSTGVSDSATGLQTAITYASTNNLDLYVPPGTYLCSAKLTVARPNNDTNGMRIRGAGRGRSIIKYTGAASIGTLLDIDGTASGWTLNNCIEGFKLDLTGAPAGTIGLKVNAGVWRSIFRDLYVTRDKPAGVRTGVGIYMGSATPADVGCFDNKFHGIYVNSFSKNLHFQGTDLSGNTITNCPVDQSYISDGDINYQAEFYNGLSMWNTQLESHVQYGFYAVNGETMVIMGGTIESPVGGAVGIGMDANTKSVVAICDFYNNTGGHFVGNGKPGHFYKTSQSGLVTQPGSEIRFDDDGTNQAQLRFFKNGTVDARLSTASSGNAIALKSSSGTEVFKFSVSSGVLELLNSAGFLRMRDGAFLQFFVGSSATAVVKSGTGTPEGVVNAAIGSVYLRTDGGAGTTFYVKESGGTGNTGWTAK